MLKRIGLITIGQSPRDDVTGDLYTLIGEPVEFFERGALDGISITEIEKLKPERNDFPLITRMRDGSSVVVGKRKIIPLIQDRIEELEDSGVEICALLCTEEFTEIKSKIIFLMPSKLLFNITVSLLQSGNILVFVPMKEQMEYSKKKWEKTGLHVSVEDLNPYKPQENFSKMEDLIRGKGADLVLMDCIGYSLELKKKIADIIKKPVILPRSILGRIIKELL